MVNSIADCDVVPVVTARSPARPLPHAIPFCDPTHLKATNPRVRAATGAHGQKERDLVGTRRIGDHGGHGIEVAADVTNQDRPGDRLGLGVDCRSGGFRGAQFQECGGRLLR